MTSKRVLICSYYIPQADLDSFSRRLFHFVEFLREDGWSVVCVAKNPQGVDQYASLLEEMGVSVHVGLEENIERLATTEHFDVAILGFWYVAEPAMKILRRCSRGTRIVVDSGDLHFLRQARGILRNSVANELEVLDSQYASEMVRELNVYAAADAVFAVSRKEADFVNDFVGDATRAHVVPDCEDFPLSSVPFAERRGMFFVGSFGHLPNVEAVEFLCREILPQFNPELMVDHPVYIAGNGMTDAVRKCGDGLPFVRMLGWIPSIQPYLERVRVSILPLLYGAGTKRKMIQALQIGTPTVSTTIGVEGFDLRDGEEVLVADDPVEFANAAARLLREEELWERLSRQGRKRILSSHSRQTGRDRLTESLSAVLYHNVKFKQHLESHYQEGVRQKDDCLLFALREPAADRETQCESSIQTSNDRAIVSTDGLSGNGSRPITQQAIENLRPIVPEILTEAKRKAGAPRQEVLVLGVYLANKPNAVDDIVSIISNSSRYKVIQRWIALGGEPSTKQVADVTVGTILERKPKFQIINDLCSSEDLSRYEYVLLTDDDVVLPSAFVDTFLSLQANLDFSIAQPARTCNSYIDLPIVEQQWGVLARQTLFVEIGPVVSFHKSIYDLVFPFDLTSSMGWGYENVWSYLLMERGLKMGIIDIVPVDHSLRKPLAYYDWESADRERSQFLKKHKHIPSEQCFTVLNVVNLPGRA